MRPMMNITQVLTSLACPLLLLLFTVPFALAAHPGGEGRQKGLSAAVCLNDDCRDPVRLPPKPTYLIVAPRVIRPDLVVQVYVQVTTQLTAADQQRLIVTASIRKDGSQICGASETIHTTPAHRTLQMRVPVSATPGNYTLLVQGATNSASSGALFQNETALEFQTKHVSVFILPDKYVYNKKQWISFRVIAVQKNLLPVSSGSVTVYLKDPSGRILRRWINQQISKGSLRNDDLKVWLPQYHGKTYDPFPIKFGLFTIEVEGFGHTYKREIMVENWFPTRFDVNLTVPTYVFDNEYAVAGTVVANLSNFFPVRGNASITMEIQTPDHQRKKRSYQDWIKAPAEGKLPLLKQNFTVFDGVVSFSFPLSEVRRLLGSRDLVGVKLTTYAAVTDWQFGEMKIGRAVTTVYSSRIQISFLGGLVRTFKPNQQFNCYIAAYQMDGTPAATSKRLIKIQRIVENMSGQTTSELTRILIGNDGIAWYAFTPAADAKFIRVRASYHEGEWLELRARRQYSASGHYVYVTTSTRQPKVDTYMVFTVRVTTYVPQLTYLVISGGNIVTTGLLFMDVRQKTFSLAVSRDMLPEASLLVFCRLHSGEVLNDVLNFNVQGIRADGLKITINKGKDFRGNQLELRGEGDPGSYVLFSGVDYDMLARGASPFLTEHMIEEDLREYGGLHGNASFTHAWYRRPMAGQQQNVHFSSNTFAVDPNTTFTFAGMNIFTDALVMRHEGALLCNASQGFLPCHEAGKCYPLAARCDNTWNCEDGADEMGCPEEALLPHSPWALPYLGRIWFHFDQADWLSHETYIKPDGSIQIPLSAPARPSQWAVTGYSLSPDRGLALCGEPAMVDVTRPFSVTLELPATAVRGEQLGVQVAVFNYWSQPLETLIRLRGSKDYVFVHVEDFGYVESYSPRTTRGEVQTMLSLRPNEVRYIHFPILPLRTGNIRVTVDADSAVSKQTETASVTVVMDGITNVYHTSYLIDLINSGSLLLPDLAIVVPERFVVPNQREHLFVPGSQKATVSIVGDVMGPGFQFSNMGASNLVGQASGHGETWIFDVGIDVMWLRYLKAANQLTEKRLQSSLREINKDLVRMYSQMKPEGWFAMHRSKNPPNVFITSFGLETLADLIQVEWDQVTFIEPRIINNVATWLCQQQNKTTGAFSETGLWSDRKMLDPLNMTDAYGRPRNISLTAYATIALARAKDHITGAAAAVTATTLSLAADYLYSQLWDIWDPFQVCITAYALHMANHRAKDEAFTRLRQLQRAGEFIYWSREEIPPNPTNIVNTIIYQYPKPWHPHEAFAIQATAYGLMVYLIQNQFQAAVPIMKWLQTQRNADGSFAGTQSTIVALRALAEFSDRDPNRGLYNMLIHLESTSSPSWAKDIHLNRGAVNQYTTYSVPNVWGSVRPRVQGTGYALIQMTVKVNVERPWQVRRPVRESFDLVVEDLVFSGRNASRMDVKVCTRWLLMELAPRSGLTIFEADIPTGFEISVQSLRDDERSAGNPAHRRSRFSKGKLSLWFDYIEGHKWTCFTFHAMRWYPVANSTIQHKMTIYEQQEPANFNTTLYTTYDLFHNHICLVCGSFQCPYCPYYNAVPTEHSSSLALIVLALTVAFGLQYFDTRHARLCDTYLVLKSYSS